MQVGNQSLYTWESFLNNGNASAMLPYFMMHATTPLMSFFLLLLRIT